MNEYYANPQNRKIAARLIEQGIDPLQLSLDVIQGKTPLGKSKAYKPTVDFLNKLRRLSENDQPIPAHLIEQYWKDVEHTLLNSPSMELVSKHIIELMSYMYAKKRPAATAEDENAGDKVLKQINQTDIEKFKKQFHQV